MAGILKALQAGAAGYALKGVGGADLMRIARSVANGEVYVPPSLAANLLVNVARHPAPAPASASPADALSDRERRVLELLAGGQSNREIGERLHLTEKTLKFYVTSILQKLSVRNRFEAALQAHELSIV
jgi:DNA-binding NarL/FixJ family response regulator